MASDDISRLDQLLMQAKVLPAGKQKKVAAILGSVVADAAGTDNLVELFSSYSSYI